MSGRKMETLGALGTLAHGILAEEPAPDVMEFMETLAARLRAAGVTAPEMLNTPYVNTIPVEDEPDYPGDRAIERRIKSYVRWNAMAMVVKANRRHAGIGGHISTGASIATLCEAGFNHFFRGPDGEAPADMVYFQGHASPSVYARAYLEGRLGAGRLHNFRQELAEGGGLPSYPHPYLMPEFWQFPTVSMGLGPVMSIYQSRFHRYLAARGLGEWSEEPRVWCFVGDGEMDEPETRAGLDLAGREKLDRLIWVVNCNLQRLDGPVRGNGKIIQELESTFRGAGWNVIKVIWGSDWDELLASEHRSALVARMEEAVDGDYQKYSVEPGSFTRKHFFGTSPELTELVAHLTDAQIHKLRRGGHDPLKVYAAYHAALRHEGKPTVVIAKTVKGYGLGEAGEGRNVTHQQKKLNEKELREFRDRFEIPISDEEVVEAPFYRPAARSDEMKYLLDRREQLGGFLPARRVTVEGVDLPGRDRYGGFFGGSDSAASTTMAFVRLLAMLMRDESIGPRVVPIIPDEARTFGMDSLFRQHGIYAAGGQRYEPVDRENLLYYREAEDGQILEEGITEAGSMSSFIAAGTNEANHGRAMFPFFIFYSMFGFQRIGDLIWAAGDIMAKGFLLGATAGRTTLNGEGLQHQDGHSQLLASTHPGIISYDPAYAYEIAVIVREGLRRMQETDRGRLYYLTLQNENYQMPAMPEGVEKGILRGLYRLRDAENDRASAVHLFGSGTILREVLRAREILDDRFDVPACVWSATSYGELRRDALAAGRWNRLHPEGEPQRSYLEEVLDGIDGPIVAASDWMKAVPDQIAPWVAGRMVTLGTDGFGRSDTREGLRRFFEVDAESIALAALGALRREGKIGDGVVADAMEELDYDPEKRGPEIYRNS